MVQGRAAASAESRSQGGKEELAEEDWKEQKEQVARGAPGGWLRCPNRVSQSFVREPVLGALVSTASPSMPLPSLPLGSALGVQ